MRVESRCYSSSAINNENNNNLNGYSGIEDRTTIVSNLADQNTALSGTTKKEKNTGGFFSFLQKLRIANKNNLVDSTFSLPSPYSSAYSVTTGRGRWESVESVISSATAHSFAFIPSHQLRQFNNNSNPQRSQIAPPKKNAGVVEDETGLRALYQRDPSSRKNRSPYYGKNSIVDAKKLHRNSTGNIENSFIAGNDPDRYDFVSSTNAASLFDRKESAQKEKRKHCHKPGKRKAPEPPYLCDNVENTNVPKKVASRRRKKRKAPSPPKIMSEEKSRPFHRDQGENTTAMYNDSLKLEKGVLKAMKSREGNATDKSDGTVENRASNYATTIPVSPKPWYKRSTVNASMKKTCRSNEKRDSCRDCIDEWMLESGLPRVQRLSDPFKRTSQISVLANISELDREAGEIIEKERRKKLEAEEKFYSDVLYDTDNEEFNSKTSGSMAKKNKDLISILNNITNVTTKITVNTPIFAKSVKVNDSPLERLCSSSSFRRTEHLKNNRTLEKQFENNVRQETQFNVQKQENRDVCREKVETVEKNLETTITEVDASKFSEKVKNKLGHLHSPHRDVHYVAQIRPVKPFSSWTCPQCTLENPSWKFICELCHKWRPYSVNRIQNTLITPKEDITLKTDDDGGGNTATPDGKVELNVNSANDEQQKMQVPLPTNEENLYRGKTTALSPETSSNFLISNDLILQDLEKIRKARLQFFTKNISNKWSKLQTFETENRLYHDRNKEDLYNILKELKNTLPPSLQSNIAKVNCEEYVSKSNTSGRNIDSDNITNPNDNRMRSPCDENIEKLKPNFFNMNDDGNAPAKYGPDETKIVPKSATKPEDVLYGKVEPSISWQHNRGPSSLNFNNEASDETRENRKITALAINRLLKKLQTAIGNGQHHEAANIARELARLKVNCHVTRRNPPNKQNLPKLEQLSTLVIRLYINERNECRGPIPLQIDNTMTLKKLKMKILDEFKIPLDSQRWVFEKIILNNENDILEEIGIDKPGAPLYLNLISTNLKKESNLKIIRNDDDSRPTTNSNSTQNAKNTNDSARIAKELEQSVYRDENRDDKKKEKLTNLKFQNNDSDSQITNEATAVDRSDSEIQISAPSTSKTTEEYIDEVDARNAPEWKCTMCTLINEINNKFCLVCGHEQNTTNRLDDTNITVENKSLVAGNYEQKSVNYQELIDLEKSDLITNKDDFGCRVCLLEYKCGEGVVLRDCLHTFCKECLKQTIQHSTEAEVKCPFGDGNYSCESVLQQREIKALVDADIYEKHLARSVSEAENKIANAFHCKTANCPGWCIFEDNVNEFHCPVCERTNCLTCQVIHTGLNCKQYQEMTKNDLETSADAFKTKSLLQEMVEKGDAMICPTCEIILMKKWGCDWLRCSMCKTEICWVTRGSRWGPAGKGDTTGGCRCGVNGIKCHPKCNYCH